MKEENIVPPLSDGMYVATVAFVQDSTTCILQLNRKLQRKCKLSPALCYSVEFCEAKRYQLDKLMRKRELAVLNLYWVIPRHQINWQTLRDKFVGIWQHLQNEICANFRDFLQEKINESEFSEILLLLALIRCQCEWKRRQINYKLFTLRKVLSLNKTRGGLIGTVWNILTPSEFGRWNCKQNKHLTFKSPCIVKISYNKTN